MRRYDEDYKKSFSTPVVSSPNSIWTLSSVPVVDESRCQTPAIAKLPR
jgi:hypothetical protein